MQIDIQYLRRHYASLSDEALREINRDELVEAARNCYDEELARRGPSARPEPEEAEGSEATASEVEEDWFEDAACACSFVTYPGSDAASDADIAMAALESAGIPCHLALEEIAPDNPNTRPHREYRVLVPAPLNLQALSVLDQEIFNPKVEAEWRAHFEVLSDDELRALDPEAMCAGLLDRVERLKNAYADELERRNL